MGSLRSTHPAGQRDPSGIELLRPESSCAEKFLSLKISAFSAFSAAGVPKI
jgi:hypothetical protein